MKHYLYKVSLLLAMVTCNAYASDFVLKAGKRLSIACLDSEKEVVSTAIGLLERDYKAVMSGDAKITTNGRKSAVVVGTVGESSLIDSSGADLSKLTGLREAFMLTVLPDGRLLIAGSDKRGTAYGVMQLSRLLGVSPWEWWADSTPHKLNSFRLPQDYCEVQSPSVDFRGIFINDEDWGLTPWSWRNYEPTDVQGQIGPKTHERIFELLLRLRANTFWPAMHECSVPFYFTDGNKEVAERYGIYIGTSHCEPMMRNTNGEWRRDGVGEYDYVNNGDNVRRFWEQRVKEVARLDNIYTLGMRGVHDGAMNGAKTTEEQKNVLNRVIDVQRKMIGDYVNSDVTAVPQVFIPYKEVLDVYNAGLSVPDDVTLMWCDDNYGYIRHFPTEAERARSGGNGVYYHASYWGRPHDYLWLGTTAPSLICHQMSLAYECGIRRMWILNVGDIKPLEYQIELFLDLAWNIDEVKTDGVTEHQYRYMEREFGADAAEKLQPLMGEFYRLAFIRRPEFMGHTRTEERDPGYKVVSDLPWSESEIRERLDAYRNISDSVESIKSQIPTDRLNTYFQLVEYPVKAAAQMNRKMLMAQLARHGKAGWNDSDAAYDSIASLTRIYNTPKWNYMMDFQPRRLPVFDKVSRSGAETKLVEHDKPVCTIESGNVRTSASTIDGLGYRGKSFSFDKGASMVYEIPECDADSLEVEVALLPSHPVDGGKLRFLLMLDNSPERVVDYATAGRSEEWKENVLRNRAIRSVTFPLSGERRIHELRFTAVDDGVVLDDIIVYARKR